MEYMDDELPVVGFDHDICVLWGHKLVCTQTTTIREKQTWEVESTFGETFSQVCHCFYV